MVYILRRFGILIIFSLILMLTTAYADDISVAVNGNALTFDVPAQVIDGRTMVPMRAIFAELGAEVTWDDWSQIAVAVKGDTVISVKIGEPSIKVNDSVISLDTAPQIIDGRTLVPVRAIAEGLGCFVRWDDAAKTVYISDAPLLTVHFIDVGQADSAFIELPNGKTVLIDAGTKSGGKVVSAYLKPYCKKIDYLIATHPHEDHIGGMAEIIDTFEIGEIYMPKVSHDTKTFENLLSTISDNNLTVKTARAGVNMLDEVGLKADFIAPVSDKYSNLNNYSAVLKITYNDASFLFMADAEEPSEHEITADVKADVIKIGHHGGYTSTTEEFIKKVSPTYAVISVGKNNSYGHPNSGIIERIEALGSKIYRTDLDGTIVLYSDGNNINKI